MEVNERGEETKILIIFSLFLVAFCIISITFLGVIFTCLFDDDYKFIKKDNKTWYYKDNSDNKIIIHKINENWYWYEAYF